MPREPTYQAARAVAAAVESHFSRHLAEALGRGKREVAARPTAEVIEAIVDAAFWASLRREEGRSPRISLAYLPPEQACHPLLFERPLRLLPSILTKIAPAVERPGIHLGVWGERDQLRIWGATRTIPSLCFVLEVIEAGLLVIKHRRLNGFGKFANVAVLEGEQVKVVDDISASSSDCPAFLSCLLGLASPSPWNLSIDVLVQLALSMREHGRGGSLLIVPSETLSWRESIVHPISYSVVPPFSGLADLTRQDRSEKELNFGEEAILRAVEGLAGLTAVDGATIVGEHYELIAFGAKIGRREGMQPVERLVTTEPIVGGTSVVLHPAQIGGTRHLSAAQFIHDQRDSLALVASQDGRFTIFTWSSHEEMVHAHRIDILLL